MGLLGQCLQVDVQGVAETLGRQRGPSALAVSEEIDELLKSFAQRWALKDCGVCHVENPIQECSLFALFKHIKSRRASDFQG